jgi:hypothetical protein
MMVVGCNVDCKQKSRSGRPGGVDCARASEGQFKGTTPDMERNLKHPNNSTLPTEKSCFQTISGCSCGVNRTLAN